MKKSTIVIMTTMILLGWISNVYAAEILGYPIVAKQAKFYSIILGVIAASIALVAGSYLCFWLVDLKKRALKPALGREREGFSGVLAAAGQSAK